MSRNVAVGNVLQTFRDAFERLDLAERWSQPATGQGDVVRVEGNAAAASYLLVSKSPFDPGTETVLETQAAFMMPFKLAVGLHVSQRTTGQEASIEAVSTDDWEPPGDLPGPLPAYTPEPIAAITQAGTTLTITTTLPHGLTVGDRAESWGVPDSRFNYPNMVVATAPTPTQITVTAGAMGALPTLTAGPVAGGFLGKRPALGRARNGASMIFEHAGTAGACFYVRSEAGDAAPSGAIAGNHAVTVGSTISVAQVTAAGVYSAAAPNITELLALPDRIQWYDYAADSPTTLSASRAARTRVVPNPMRRYRVRLRVRNSQALTVPVAKVVSATKTGTTTTTIVTDLPHGLTTSHTVVIAGVRDRTNFTPSQVPVLSVINATSFTVAFGAAITGVSFGGSVYLVNGGIGETPMGALSQSVQSASRTAGVLTLIGSAAWSGVAIGDLVDTHGLRAEGTGADLGLDGVYRVRNLATTALDLEPLDAIVPMPVDLVSTPCGGTVIRRTDVRLDFVRVQEFTSTITEQFGSLAAPMDAAAMPVRVLGFGLGASAALIGDVGVQYRASATGAGGATNYTSPATPAGLVIKGSPGRLEKVNFVNISGAIRWVKFFNATSIVPGTTPALFERAILPNQPFDFSLEGGIAFSTGIVIMVTAARGQTDATATGLAVGDVTGFTVHS